MSAARTQLDPAHRFLLVCVIVIFCSFLLVIVGLPTLSSIQAFNEKRLHGRPTQATVVAVEPQLFPLGIKTPYHKVRVRVVVPDSNQSVEETFTTAVNPSGLLGQVIEIRLGPSGVYSDDLPPSLVFQLILICAFALFCACAMFVSVSFLYCFFRLCARMGWFKTDGRGKVFMGGKMWELDLSGWGGKDSSRHNGKKEEEVQ